MAYTLERECAIVLVYNGTGYLFDALSQFDFNQTYNKSSWTRKTLHSKKAKPYVTANAKSAASFNCTVYCTDSFSEGVLFELAGLHKKYNNIYEYTDELGINPSSCEIFVISKTATYKLEKAALESLEVSMNRTDPLAISVSFTASNLLKTKGIDMGDGLIRQGEPLVPTPIQYQFNNIPNKHIRTAGVSIQQTIDWRNDRGLHDINTLYTPTEPILTERSFGLNITSYLNSNIKVDEGSTHADIEVYKSGMSIILRDALVTSRVNQDAVFSLGQDVTVTSRTHTVIVEYGGIWYEN